GSHATSCTLLPYTTLFRSRAATMITLVRTITSCRKPDSGPRSFTSPHAGVVFLSLSGYSCLDDRRAASRAGRRQPKLPGPRSVDGGRLAATSGAQPPVPRPRLYDPRADQRAEP